MTKNEKVPKLNKDLYEAELEELQAQLVEMQEWVKQSGSRVIIIFEGRDAAGKGGAIKRITEPLNPRVARIVVLPTLCGASSGRRRDSAVRSLMVQPCGCGACHGLLHPRGVPQVPSAMPCI